jgi:hypothetical protein
LSKFEDGYNCSPFDNVWPRLEVVLVELFVVVAVVLLLDIDSACCRLFWCCCWFVVWLAASEPAAAAGGPAPHWAPVPLSSAENGLPIRLSAAFMAGGEPLAELMSPTGLRFGGLPGLTGRRRIDQVPMSGRVL